MRLLAWTFILIGTLSALGNSGTDNPVPVQGGGHVPILGAKVILLGTPTKPCSTTPNAVLVGPERVLEASAPAGPTAGKGKKGGVTSSDNGAKKQVLVARWEGVIVPDAEVITEAGAGESPKEVGKRHEEAVRLYLSWNPRVQDH